MNYDEFSESVDDAEFTLGLADMWTNKFALLVSRRLRQVSHANLCRLKRELAKYNTKTGRWK